MGKHNFNINSGAGTDRNLISGSSSSSGIWIFPLDFRNVLLVGLKNTKYKINIKWSTNVFTLMFTIVHVNEYCLVYVNI